MGPSFELPSVDAGRRERLQFLRAPHENILSEFEKKLQEKKLHIACEKCWKISKKIDYQHVGLSKLAYLSHPIRVASIYMDVVEFPSSHGVNLALLHNLIEVSDISYTNLVEKIGKDLAHDISLLTVDRSHQWDKKYKERYYKVISQSRLEVRQVKVLDKLDNLYMLCLNESDEIRTKYLLEIDAWVKPIAEDCLPNFVSYIDELVEFNKEIGFMPEC